MTKSAQCKLTLNYLQDTACSQSSATEQQQHSHFLKHQHQPQDTNSYKTDFISSSTQGISQFPCLRLHTFLGEIQQNRHTV